MYWDLFYIRVAVPLNWHVDFIKRTPTSTNTGRVQGTARLATGTEVGRCPTSGSAPELVLQESAIDTPVVDAAVSVVSYEGFPICWAGWK